MASLSNKLPHQRCLLILGAKVMTVNFFDTHILHLYGFRSIHDVKATDLGADSVRFKAEVNFDGREVARIHVNKLDLEEVLKVCLTFVVLVCLYIYMYIIICHACSTDLCC